MLCRQAARKFDAATVERLSGVLNGLADPERLGEVGEWIIECETGAELLALLALEDGSLFRGWIIECETGAELLDRAGNGTA